MTKEEMATWTAAIRESLDFKPTVAEETVHVHGYGIVNKEVAEREAKRSTDDGLQHAGAGNHAAAAYHLERAAMFHKALHLHNSKV